MIRYSTISPRSGFVLVLVLVSITVAGFSVAGLARQSLELAREVAEAQESLQRRWGVLSCQRLLLGNAERLLDFQQPGATAVTTHPWPTPASLDTTFVVAGLQFAVHLSDEDAKANLNALASQGRQQHSKISTGVRESVGTQGLTVLLRFPPDADGSVSDKAFQTWEQVFDLHGLDEVRDLATRLQAATTRITCWGSGRLNIRRAPDAVVRLVTAGEVSETVLRKLLAERGTGKHQKLEEILSQLSAKTKDLQAFNRLLTDSSKCYSLWLTIGNSRRTWTTFTIDRTGQGSPTSFESFTW